MANTQGDPVGGDEIAVGDIEGVGIAIGTGASVKIYGDVHYYPIKLRALLREVFDPLLDDRTALFAGRDVVLARIGEFIQDPAGGYLVITAPAGFGKTALMANLISRTPEAFAYHFFTSIYVTDGLSENFFLRNVVEQLAQWHDHKGVLPSTLHELSALYHKFLDEPLERTQVLVLDGLDEVASWKLNRYLSRRAPPNLHIILTVRDVGQDWAREYGLAVDQIKHLPLGGLNRDEVAQVLRAAGQDAVVFAENPQLLNEVMRISAYQADEALGADPFYVRLLAEDAAEGRLTPDKIPDRPQGLDSYLDDWWQEIKKLAGDQPARDLFGTLTICLGPIRRAELEAINPSLVDAWAGDFFDDILGKVRRWVVGDVARGYSMAHPRLRHYMDRRIKTGPYQEILLAFCRNWQDHLSPYSLTYCVDHLEAAGLTAELYTTILDPAFREAQRTVLGDTSKTLDDLRLAIKLTLANDAVVTALACVAAYRYTTRTTSIAQAILDAVDDKDFEKALKLVRLKGAAPDWGRVLHLYLAWEAALENKADISRRAVQEAERLSLEQAGDLCDALLVRTACALAGDIPDNVRANLAMLGHEQDAGALLAAFPSAQPIPEAQANQLLDQLEPQLEYLEQAAAGGHAEGISAVMFLETEAEESPDRARDLREPLLKLAAHASGPQSVERILNAILTNPYPHYRDIALVTTGRVAAAVPDDGWVRTTLRHVLMTGLDLEGVTFTFDLPFILLEEAHTRGLPTPQLHDLPDHRQRALGSPDRWGTTMRAHSAYAAALFRKVDRDWAFKELETAALEPSGFAGYATLHFLSLSNRWCEFGQQHRAGEAVELLQNQSLLDAAAGQASIVRDEVFRNNRVRLVETYRTWLGEEIPGTDQALRILDQIQDYATRLAYIDHLSARWAWPDDKPNWVGLKALVPLALVDGTTLDAVLARLCGLYLSKRADYSITDVHLVEAIRVCSQDLMTGQPWRLGQWR